MATVGITPRDDPKDFIIDDTDTPRRIIETNEEGARAARRV
jgi:hypothetical protein